MPAAIQARAFITASEMEQLAIEIARRQARVVVVVVAFNGEQSAAQATHKHRQRHIHTHTQTRESSVCVKTQLAPIELMRGFGKL